MSAYLIANVKVTDDSWIPEYTQRVTEIVHKHGGKFLSRSGNIIALEQWTRKTETGEIETGEQWVRLSSARQMWDWLGY